MTWLKHVIKRFPGSNSAYALAKRSIARIRVTQDFLHFRAKSRHERPDLSPLWEDRQFFLENRTTATPFDRHYIYHTAWALRQLQRHKPIQHVDISSSLSFVALASAIVQMRHIDYRPPSLVLNNLECAAGDLMSLPFADNSVSSLSCMHVIEHVGLARYGDPLDPSGDLKSAKELTRVLAAGGRLYFVAPVGRARVCFNAHRIYDYQSVRALFPALELEEWALVPDEGPDGLVFNAAPDLMNSQQYACGCFVFRKFNQWRS